MRALDPIGSLQRMSGGTVAMPNYWRAAILHSRLIIPISKRPVLPLQIAIAVGGLVPVGAGLAGVWLGPAMLDPGLRSGAVDNHFRYLSGLLLGIGLLFWSMIPNIASRGPAVRLLTFAVVVGGLARATGFLLGDPVTPAGALALTMELVVTPMLCGWQAWVGSGK